MSAIDKISAFFIEQAEKGRVPDRLIRLGIRELIKERHREARALNQERLCRLVQDFVDQNEELPIAVATEQANLQHYEVSSEFFELVLGRNLKYSGCLWEQGTRTLDEAEDAMLDLSTRRALLEDDQDVLELGCGWGSLTLWMARHFPQSRITAVSNSRTQKVFIEERCRREGIENVRVITADVNQFEPDSRFDRVVSVEMFEHVKNHRALLKRISGWLKPEGRLFVHIFSHRSYPYHFETEGAGNWMGRYFFTGGMMPSDDMLLYLQDDLAVEEHWRVSGEHYARTARAWLDRLDLNRRAVREALAKTYPPAEVDRWVERWRIFFMACEELFAFDQGRQWIVSHYRFRKTGCPE